MAFDEGILVGDFLECLDGEDEVLDLGVFLDNVVVVDELEVVEFGLRQVVVEGWG